MKQADGFPFEKHHEFAAIDCVTLNATTRLHRTNNTQIDRRFRVLKRLGCEIQRLSDEASTVEIVQAIVEEGVAFVTLHQNSCIENTVS